MEAGGIYCWNKPKIPPEVCNVNEKQMIGSLLKQKEGTSANNTLYKNGVADL